MKDELMDIVRHTHGLGFINLVKIEGTDKETLLNGLAEDQTVIVQAKFHKVIKDFEGVFGMPNLNKLNVILGIPEYKDDAKIQLQTQKRNNEVVPVGIHFENTNGDFQNDYRFMTTDVINEKLKSIKFRGANWHVEFKPSESSIQRLKYQAQANSEELTFVAKTEQKDLKFFFGDHSSHAGNFIFQSGVTGTLKHGWNWPVAQVISILGLPGDIEMKFSDDGIAMISVDSGIAKYEYMLPAHQQ